MAISKRKDRHGRHVGYQVTVSVPDPHLGKSRRVVLGTYLRRKEADAAERDAKVRIQAGTFSLDAPASVPTVAEAVDIWFQTKRQVVQPNSIAGYESAIRLHVLPAVGPMLVTALTNDLVQLQVNRWRDEGMGARLLHRCVMILRVALARQVKNGVIGVNPALEIEKPSARLRKELVAWNDRQLAAFLATAETHRLAPLWFFTLVEGMRRGEALGLRWRDLQWSDDGMSCVARISQTIVPDLAHGGAALVQDRAKTRSSQRGVQLTGDTIRVLKAHQDRQEFERRAAGDVWAENGLLITTRLGTPYTPSSVKRDLATLIARVGVTSADGAGVERLPPVTTHGLRHMSATIMLRSGTSPAIVAAKLGHSDIGTTVDRYGHLTVSDQRSANDAIERAIGRARRLS